MKTNKMDDSINSNKGSDINNPGDLRLPEGAEELSALDLNNIKLDPKHTVLSPDYLERLINGGGE